MKVRCKDKIYISDKSINSIFIVFVILFSIVNFNI